ncbi:aminoglycoside phosphotransferase [Streptomyces venezuelae]|uniref:Aminoglycoside phosphotransferase n=1 Tax=Streptomyces venezuelae TaxID=54571 RepID=A0A5P2DI93_STRVZ|nr:aminoglycoside phosphotransferase [Streptomyces venezuelae]
MTAVLAEVAARAAGGVPGPRRGGVLAERADGTVVRCGDAVAKAHAADTDRAGLAARLRVAAAPELAGVLLPPLRPAAEYLRGRAVTVWPYGAPVDPGRPEDAPWAAAGRLLGLLHQVPVDRLPGPVPPMRGPAKLARALRRMTGVLRDAGPPAPGAGSGTDPGAERGNDPGTGPDVGSRADSGAARAARAVLAAAATLPAWARNEAPVPVSAGPTLCHGDLHLGQLVHTGSGWRLIDVDDLGVGPAAWDLARPAAWYAAGLLAPEDWLCFLDAYRQAGGPAAGPPGIDPWPELDLAARALTVQTGALAVARAGAGNRRLDEVERAMTDACGRIADLPPELESAPPS